MLIKNVYYQEQPEPFEIRRYGKNMATVVFPTEVSETEEGDYLATKVYALDVNYTTNLRERIENNFEAWLSRAKKPEIKEATLEDVIEAVNALTDIILEDIALGGI